jgi:hypothetical protein
MMDFVEQFYEQMGTAVAELIPLFLEILGTSNFDEVENIELEGEKIANNDRI